MLADGLTLSDEGVTLGLGSLDYLGSRVGVEAAEDGLLAGNSAGKDASAEHVCDVVR